MRITVALGLGAVLAAALFAVLKPRPTRLAVTARPGDDTIVVNQMRPTRLPVSALNQYGRRLGADSMVRYRRVSGDAIPLAPDGRVTCANRADAVLRASLGSLVKDFTLRCRPVAAIEAPSWVDLVVGDSTRDLPFVARGPDGSVVTELRGTVTVRTARSSPPKARQSGRSDPERPSPSSRSATGRCRFRLPSTSQSPRSSAPNDGGETSWRCASVWLAAIPSKRPFPKHRGEQSD